MYDICTYITQSEISQERRKIRASIRASLRSYHSILRYLYTEAIKRRVKFRCIDTLRAQDITCFS